MNKTHKQHSMMNRLLLLSFLCVSLATFSQSALNELRGQVSFISSENVYVRFVNTNGIHIGDTLFIVRNDKKEPALIVTNLSSISCVGKPVGNTSLSLTNTLIAFNKNSFTSKRISETPPEVTTQKSAESVSVNDAAIKRVGAKASGNNNRAGFEGRVSISSYSNFSSDPLSLNTPNYRLRYNLALNATHIANSGLSFENYMSYTHTLNNPDEKFNNLNVYNLAFNYEFDKTAVISLGRKINVNTANIGAVDGLQFEKHFKHFAVGALAGTRPNDSTYFFDPKLFQYGAFISHTYQKEARSTQTSVAFFNQTNRLKTDRRYMYLQHQNSFVKNVDFFGSSEIDLYSIENNQPVSDFSLTSLYLSLSYRPVHQLSLSVSYDARKNVYYYETYKNKIDSLLEKEMREGLRFRFNYHPFNYFYWGGNAGYRLQTPTSHESMNAISYLTYSNIPGVNASLTVSATALKTANVSGYIYGASLSKSLMNDNLFAELEYRKELIYNQDIIDLSASWKLPSDIFLSTDFEGTLDQGTVLGRVFINVSKRF